ncbi:MAG: hypothetical protein LBS61_03130 [Endomicrobium sp.]|jgi:hypothetical protein|nr:hypothetical protein [Endomicrobium sp.]
MQKIKILCVFLVFNFLIFNPEISQASFFTKQNLKDTLAFSTVATLVSGAIVFYIKDRIDYRKLLPETQEKIQEKLRIYDELRNT